jgi:hypothetical protein
MTIADDLSVGIRNRGLAQSRLADTDEESDRDDGRRWSTVRGHDGSSVHVAVLRHGADAEVVWLHAEHGASLTPAQARSASQALLAAASLAEDHRAPEVVGKGSAAVDL